MWKRSWSNPEGAASGRLVGGCAGLVGDGLAAVMVC